jgi:hypothetical protein
MVRGGLIILARSEITSARVIASHEEGRYAEPPLDSTNRLIPGTDISFRPPHLSTRVTLTNILTPVSRNYPRRVGGRYTRFQSPPMF